MNLGFNGVAFDLGHAIIPSGTYRRAQGSNQVMAVLLLVSCVVMLAPSLLECVALRATDCLECREHDGVLSVKSAGLSVAGGALIGWWCCVARGILSLCVLIVAGGLCVCHGDDVSVLSAVYNTGGVMSE